MNELYLLKNNTTERFAYAGRPSTIRVYESLESAKRGLRFYPSYSIVKLSVSDLKAVEGVIR